jgi:glycosyltransferase involved in cell wall biosynthesis
MTRRISIALATYNGALFLRDQLDSLVAQTLPPYEIVVCDDDSTDGTRDLVAAYAADCPIPISLIHQQPRLGWRANFIDASGRCGGDLIGFCDQDDVWHPDKLATLAACFDTPGVTMAYHDFTPVDRDLGPLGASPHPRVAPLSPPLAVDAWLSVLGFTMVFDAKLLTYWPLWEASIDKHRTDLPAAHDQWVVFLASMLGSIAYVDRPLALYRQHGANAVGLTPGAAAQRRGGAAPRHVTYLEGRLAVIANRLALIARMAALDPAGRLACDAATAHYARYRDMLTGQLRLHRSPGAVERLSALATLVRHGAYGRGPWQLPPRALLRDSAIALAGAGQGKRGGPDG